MPHENLVAFWRDAPLDAPPYVHPRDNLLPKQIQRGVNSYTDFILALSNGELDDTALHTGLLPQPYLGDLANAEIVILLMNPGLCAADYYLEENHPAFREELIASIRQVRRDNIFLDPRWAWTAGFTWWERKLRQVAKEIASERFNGNYGRALADLGRRIVALELIPYHSSRFGASKRIASAEAARAFASVAMQDRTIIVTRGVADWSLPDTSNVIKYNSGQARGASLGVNTVGGRAILSAYGL